MDFNEINFNEIIGYLASAFVVISLLMSDMKKLRYINLLGCCIFVVYGVIELANPVIVTNLALAIINIYHILKLPANSNRNKKIKKTQ